MKNNAKKSPRLCAERLKHYNLFVKMAISAKITDKINNENANSKYFGAISITNNPTNMNTMLRSKQITDFFMISEFLFLLR